MCCEDTLIGFNSPGYLRKETVADSSGVVIPPAPRRTAIILLSASAGTITVTPGTGAVASQGIIVNATGQPIELHTSVYGQLVSEQWSAVADTTGRVLTYIEVLDGYCTGK